MSRIYQIAATASKPATDDYGVIDGLVNGPRKIRFGSAAVLDAPEPGSNAGAGQLVRGDDPRLTGGSGATALNDLTDVEIATPGPYEHLVYSPVLQRWVNNAVTDGGNF